MRLAISLLLFCALTPWQLSAAESLNVAALAEAYEHPKLGPWSRVQNLTVGISNMTFELTSGSASPVTVGNQVVGLFFRGQGKYAYQSVDPIEATLTTYESRKLNGKTPEKNGGVLTIRGEINELYLLVGGVSLPELPPSGGEPPDPAFAKHQEKFSHARYAPASHLLIRQRLDRTATPVAVAEMDGDGTSVYMFDTIEAKSESLTSLIIRREIGAPALRNALFGITISDQPVGRDRRAFLEPNFIVTNLDYTLVAGDKETANLAITETIEVRNRPQSAFRFNLASMAIDTNGRGRDFHVSSVTDSNGTALPFHFAKDSILVGTPAKLAANTSFKIKFQIDGDFLYHPNGDSFWQLGTYAWFPQPDLNGQYYTIHSIVKVKKPWMAFAPGETISRTDEGDFQVVENKIDKPVQFAVVHAGKYGVSVEKYDDLTIRVASYAGQNDRAMKQLGNLAWKIIKFYEPWLGPFPFKEFNIIEINQLGFGQAPPGTMFITKEAFNPTLGEDNQIFSQGINHRFAHEIAHQYWGHVVKMGTDEEQWVTEAFAEYSSSLVIKKLKGQGQQDSMIATWRANAKDVAQSAPIPLGNRIFVPGDPRLSFLDRTFLIYDKGAYLLAVLHKQLGDTKFLTFMRSLQGYYAWHFLTTKDIAAVLQKVDDGKDYKPFFEQYFWGTDMPALPKG